MIKKPLAFILLLVCCFSAFAQNYQWAAGMGGSSSDRGNSLTVDDSGNVYTTGWFQGTVDFDPGIGTFNLTSSSGDNIFISKLDSGGNFVWALRIGANFGNHDGFSITTDHSGYVYVTGQFQAPADFDPGQGTYILYNTGSVFILKLNSSGGFVWARNMGGSGGFGTSIAVDGNGYVYTTGSFRGTGDFDPGAGAYNLTAAGGNSDYDIFVSKLDNSGNFVWARNMGGTSDDLGESICFDASGNVYTTGFFKGTADFDPGAGNYSFTVLGPSYAANIFISKLNSSGDFVWAKRFSGSHYCYAISIAIDSSGNIYTTGYFWGSVDFDPGTGNYTLTSNGAYDFFISKLDSSGNFVWAKYVGSAGDEYGESITLDPSGNIYIIGLYHGGPVDFDPGAGVYWMSSSLAYGVFILKLDTSGNFVWAKTMAGNQDDWGLSVKADAHNVYATGFFKGTTDFDPNAGTANLASQGLDDIFVLKLSERPSPAGTINGPASVCFGATKSYAINTVTGATGYMWTVPTGATIISGQNTKTIFVQFGTISGSVSVTPVNSFGNGIRHSLVVTVNPPPSVHASASPSSTVCPGTLVTLTGTNAKTYTWSGGITDGVPFTALATTTYIVTGTDSNGCSNTDTITIKMNPLPTIMVSPPAPSYCYGGSVSITASGADTYSWSPAAGLSATTGATIIANPLVTTSYTVTGTSNLGCVNTKTFTVKVNPLPTVNSTASPSAVVCQGSTVTLNGTGALTYTWSGGVTNGIPFVPSGTTTYTVTGTDSNGCTNTNTRTITVKPLPGITLQPQNQIVNEGANCLFIIIPSGTSTTYQWQQNSGTGFVNLSNAWQYSGVTNDTLTISNVTFSQNNFKYRCIISDGMCSNISNTATLNVKCVLSISLQPENDTVTSGFNAMFTTKSSSPASTYQWQQNAGTGFINLSNSGQNSGVTTTTLIIMNVALSQDKYAYHCIANDGGCSDTSDAALLFIKENTGIGYPSHKFNIAVYPNPSPGKFYLLMNENEFLDMTIYNGQGRMLKTFSAYDVNGYDCADLRPGFYFIKVASVSGTKTLQLLRN